MEEIKTKKCGHCGKELPIAMFGTSNHTKDGYTSWCRPCQAEDARKRYAAKRASKEALQHAVNLAGTDADRITTTDGKSYRKVDYSPVKELKDYKPYELFAELKRRGYKWPDNTIYMKMYVNYDKIEI